MRVRIPLWPPKGVILDASLGGVHDPSWTYELLTRVAESCGVAVVRQRDFYILTPEGKQYFPKPQSEKDDPSFDNLGYVALKMSIRRADHCFLLLDQNSQLFSGLAHVQLENPGDLDHALCLIIRRLGGEVPKKPDEQSLESRAA